jgi:DNA polymerase III subunit gamma/tau
MAHQSLYRAYRPHTFDDLVGQDHIVRPLKEQLSTKKIGHAYLFSGSRGLGKTSVARIFAHELGTDDRDLYEIDAASNNSVEDIRALTEQVYTLPFNSSFKFYILDEAHMLSKSAWNAFLKTLEEPPAHAIFVLATTELEKVPETVRSRCQVFEFKKPTREVLSGVVSAVSKKEGYTLEPAAADLVALLADGSYRDALSVLEKVLASTTDKKLSLSEVEQATGAPRHALVHDLATALSSGNGEAALVAIASAGKQGVDMNLYLMLVLEHMRAVLLVRHAPELRKEIATELGSDVYGEVETLAGAKDSKLTHDTLRVFLDAASRIRFSPIPSLPLELAVMEVSRQD